MHSSLCCPGQKEQHFPEAVKRNESKAGKPALPSIDACFALLGLYELWET